MLNDTQCRNAKAKDKLYRLRDGNGLYLEVKPSGVKVWRYRFELREGGEINPSMFAIGDYVAAPNGETLDEAQARKDGRRFTLAEARKEREKARALVKQGINPAHNRKIETAKKAVSASTTFEKVAREWVALRDWEQITKDRRLDMLERVVFPKIGELPVTQVTPALVLELLKAAATKNGLSVMAEAKRTMYRVFELAAETFRVDANPVHNWSEALPANKTQHKRPLSTTEIGQLLRDVDGHGGRYETVTAFRLMWMTLCRPNEAIEAEWSEFDLDSAEWSVPAARMKKRKEHKMPLPSQAVEMLRALHGITGKHKHLFPNRDDKTKPMVAASFRQMLHVLGWSGKFSPHATRTTGSTRLNELGYSGDWIERQLAHTEPNSVRRTYNHANYYADRAKMMQNWVNLLDGYKAGAQVIPLRAKSQV